MSSLFVMSCQKEGTAPGLSVESSGAIKTFAGDEVLVEATLSDVDGIEKITVSCEAWEVLKEYDLSEQTPTVFNLSYRFTVPATAGRDFSQTLLVDVENIFGMHTTREIPMTYLPDVTAPSCANFLSAMEVKFVDGAGVLKYIFNLSDDRGVSSAKFEVDGETYEQTFAEKDAKFSINHTFTQMGNYPARFTFVDSSDNKVELDITVVVMMEEIEDPISDYERMYVIPASESPDSYVLGYWQPMKHDNPYEYWAYVYAPQDGHKIAFVPTRSVEGDYFGVSPQVSTKLMNKNGYVLPVELPKKGYYSVFINIQKNQFSVTEHTPTAQESITANINNICFVGSNLSIGNWVFGSPMSVDGMRLYSNVPVSGAEGAKVELCLTNGTWDLTWRPDANAADDVTGWWAAGNKSVEFYSVGEGDYPIVFDTGIDPMWVTIKVPEAFTPAPSDPISDYAQMWAINVSENADDYVLGYYRPIARTGEYQYAGQIYAEAGSKWAFVPVQSTDGDYFGLIGNKLTNKRGEVSPVEIAEAGYYNVVLDVKKQSYSVTAFTPDVSLATNIAGKNIYLNGENIDGENWAMVESLKLAAAGDYQLTGNLVVDVEPGTWPKFCVTDDAWSVIWRPRFNSDWTAILAWELNNGSNDSAYFDSLGTGNYPVHFDVGVTPAWLTVKKPQ